MRKIESEMKAKKTTRGVSKLKKIIALIGLLAAFITILSTAQKDWWVSLTNTISIYLSAPATYQELQDKNEEVRNLMINIDQLDIQLQQKIKDSKDMKNANEQFKIEISSLATQINDLEKDKSKLNEELRNLRMNIDQPDTQLQAEKQDLRAKLNHLQKQLSDLQAENQSLKEKLSTVPKPIEIGKKFTIKGKVFENDVFIVKLIGFEILEDESLRFDLINIDKLENRCIVALSDNKSDTYLVDDIGNQYFCISKINIPEGKLGDRSEKGKEFPSGVAIGISLIFPKLKEKASSVSLVAKYFHDFGGTSGFGYGGKFYSGMQLDWEFDAIFTNITLYQ